MNRKYFTVVFQCKFCPSTFSTEKAVLDHISVPDGSPFNKDLPYETIKWWFPNDCERCFGIPCKTKGCGGTAGVHTSGEGACPGGASYFKTPIVKAEPIKDIDVDRKITVEE